MDNLSYMRYGLNNTYLLCIIFLFFAFAKLTFKGRDGYLAEGKKRYCLLLILKDDTIIATLLLRKHL